MHIPITCQDFFNSSNEKTKSDAVVHRAFRQVLINAVTVNVDFEFPR